MTKKNPKTPAETAAPTDEPDPVAEAQAAGDTIINLTEGAVLHALESLDDGAGSIWRVTLVRPGRSRNGYTYTPEVLKEAAHLYEGVRSFDGHRSTEERRRSSVAGITGWYDNVTQAEDGSLQADYHLAESAGGIRSLFKEAWQTKRPHMIGFSHDVQAAVDRTTKTISKILEVSSVDTVADPSAGGRIEQLVAGGGDPNEGKNMTSEELAKLIAEDPDAAAAARAALAAADEAAAPANDPAPAPTPAPAAPAPTPELVGAGVSEAYDPTLAELIFDTKAGQTKLPAETVAKLKTKVLEAKVPIAKIGEHVSEAADFYSTVLAGAPQPLPGQGAASTIHVGEADYDKKVLALHGLIAGDDQKAADGESVPAFRSLREAYFQFTGRHEHNLPGTSDIGHWMLAEALGAVPQANVQRLTEAVLTTSWTSAFAETINRMLIAEYNFAPLRTWEALVSQNTSITDFKTQRRTRIGGFDVLAAVGENAAYPALTTPTDEEATLQVVKYGGTEVVTFEAFANDDLSAIRRVPTNMARAALLTIYNAIWITTIEGNAVTTYDAVALFAAGHNNQTGSVATIDEAALGTLRGKMVGQARSGETSGFIGATPKYVAHHTDDWQQFQKLTKSAVTLGASNATPNPFQGENSLIPIEVPLFTTPGDFFMFADPKSVPLLEMGWFNGRHDPEILVQDAPNVGAVFTNDRVTYKVRHIWDLAVLDHRGAQRATVAV